MRLPLDRIWYGRLSWGLLLAPLSWVYCVVSVLRAGAYRTGLVPRRRFPVPVVVVGNIAAGGTGKTPLVIWIANFLKQHGFTPAIVCRGHGGGARSWPQQVRPDSDPTMVGDEAVLLARHTGCAVAAGPDRVRAVAALIDHHPCDVVISDDGLQHYAMDRDVEIAVIDGSRRHGNGLCLPGGPLREPKSRLRRVDMVVTNGIPKRGEIGMTLESRALHGVRDPDRTCSPKALRDAPVHAVAGIGNPGRFFEQLRNLGFRLTPHPLPDHHPFTGGEIIFDDDRAVIMTEKDAVKCRPFAAARHWYLPVTARPQEALGVRLLRLLEAKRAPVSNGL